MRIKIIIVVITIDSTRVSFYYDVTSEYNVLFDYCVYWPVDDVMKLC